ncbi:MAG: hypothetical protein SNJ67_13460 [Chloracidobacterium sp.]|uniref:PE-PPE domain-containing protein n=1 Tax=Chloracidobacterium validum TaxID=2821543 RepID=A0ABX8B8P3_9BACT|nr:hypothetical protein [Chloracidobacterium validum]QUW03307.1 hypothetical protein J8C06_02380 [Chloracidobacterium validum]
MTNRIQPQRTAPLTRAVQPKVSEPRATPAAPTNTVAPANTTRLSELQMMGALRKGQVLAASATTAVATPTRLSPTGPLAGARPNPAAPTRLSPLAADSHLNGAAFRVTAPGANPNAAPPVIVVNGISTPFSGASRLAQEVSRVTGRPVEMVYNNSDPAVAAGVTLAHHTRQARARAEADYNNLPLPVRLAIGINPANREAFILGRTARYVAEAAVNPATADWTKRNALQNPPAAQTQANLILSQLENYPNSPVRVVGYSQGAAISAEALRLVEQHLARQHGQAAANQMLARVQVMTLGGAANANDFPAAVNVTSIAHQTDIVSQYFGANRSAFGRGNVGDFVNFIREGFGVRQHLNYLGANGNPEVTRRMQDWMANPAGSDRNIILPDYRG